MNQKDRVRSSFPASVNERIDRETQGRIDYALDRGSEAVARRIVELEREWDIDRALMALFPVLGGAALSAGLLKNRRFFGLLGVQLSFLLFHAVRGWCPPASVFRRMGFRTQKEIDAEREILISSMESLLNNADQRRAG